MKDYTGAKFTLRGNKYQNLEWYSDDVVKPTEEEFSEFYKWLTTPKVYPDINHIIGEFNRGKGKYILSHVMQSPDVNPSYLAFVFSTLNHKDTTENEIYQAFNLLLSTVNLSEKDLIVMHDIFLEAALKPEKILKIKTYLLNK